MSPSFGSGVGTPIPGGGSAALQSVRPLPYTLLSLSRYAQIMGINPAHFMRATANNVTPAVFPIGNCGAVWPRYAWQASDQVSHEDLAWAIQGAEADIAKLIGYWPAPVWAASEEHEWPRLFDREYYDKGLDIRNHVKSVKLDYGRYIQGGRRAVTLIGTVSPVYTDEDGDGVEETATISIATALTDACEIKVYFAGMGGAQEWEVRPVRSVTIAGGIVTFKIDSWNLIDPVLLAEYPNADGFRAIDISTTANFVSSVEVYREYTDATLSSAMFYWGDATICPYCNSTGCSVCNTTTQTGCLFARDGSLGQVVPYPASWDSTETQWTRSTWTGVVEPDYVKVWYYAGEQSNRYLSGFTCDPLSEWWAQVIAWIATARLTRPLCGCNSVNTTAEDLSRDIANARPGDTYFSPVEILRNPIGTRKGEVMAWRRISKMVKRIPNYAVV